MSTATWIRLLGFSVVLAAVMMLAPAWTQAPAGKKVALLVGVTEYERTGHFPDLKYTENDVEKLAEILRSPTAGFTVRVLTTTRGKKNAADAPTVANIRKALDALLENRGPRDTVLVALSGHGVALDVEDPDGKGRNNSYSFFCPNDADLVGVSYSTGRSKTLLNLSELFGGLGRCGAGAKLVLMDACRNELKVRRDSSTRSLNAESVTIPTGVGALFSCKAGEFAHESSKLKHGVFFHFVLEGLRGAAQDEDNEVTWLSLRAYVTKKVRREAAALVGEAIKQTPHPIDNIPGESPVLNRPGKEAVRPKEKDRPEVEKVTRKKDSESSDEVPNINKRGDDEKKFLEKLAKAIVPAARTAVKTATLWKWERREPKPDRLEYHIVLGYKGAVTKKDYTAHIVVHVDTSTKDKWEVTRIEYKDDSKAVVGPNRKNLDMLVDKLNGK
jgi:uncharacterized caspase-like protein